MLALVARAEVDGRPGAFEAARRRLGEIERHPVVELARRRHDAQRAEGRQARASPRPVPISEPVRIATPLYARGRCTTHSAVTHAPCENPPTTTRPGSSPSSPNACSHASIDQSSQGTCAACGCQNRPGYHDRPPASSTTNATSSRSTRSTTSSMKPSSWSRPQSRIAAARHTSGAGPRRATGAVRCGFRSMRYTAIGSSIATISSRCAANCGGTWNSSPRCAGSSSIAQPSGFDQANSKSAPLGVLQYTDQK